MRVQEDLCVLGQDLVSCYFCFVLLPLGPESSLVQCNTLVCFVLLCQFVCLTGFVNCLVKQFAICLGVVDILLLKVMVSFSVVRGALLDRLCMVFHLCP